MKNFFSTTMLIVSLALIFLAPAAHGRLAQVGPVDPVGGFPDWYMDDNGLALEPCLAGPARCGNSAVIPGNRASVNAGFGNDAFYWAVDPVFPLGANGEDMTGTGVSLNLGWNTPNLAPLAGSQMVFSRLRLRVDRLTTAGNYTFVMPWGSLLVPATPKAGNRGPFSITLTDDDIGLAATGFVAPLFSPNVGPFLKATNAPAGFVGNGATALPFTGGINGNFFQLLSPTGAVITTATRGIITGKLATRGGLQQVSASYSRTPAGNGTVDVTAHSISGQQIVVTGVGAAAVQLLPQAGNLGHYAASIPFTAADSFSPITVVNQTDARVPKPSVTINRVKDVVTITSATFSAATQTLTVTAASSDRSTTPPRPSLRVFDSGSGALLGRMRRGTFSFVTARPLAVRVVSNKGGRDNARVNLIP